MMMAAFILATSVRITAGLPPRPIWDVLSEHACLDECVFAWKALRLDQQMYAKCMTPDELEQAREPVPIHLSPR